MKNKIIIFFVTFYCKWIYKKDNQIALKGYCQKAPRFYKKYFFIEYKKVGSFIKQKLPREITVMRNGINYTFSTWSNY